MEKIELVIKDKRDLMYLWSSLNHLQVIARNDLVRNATTNAKIESQWMTETVEEWDRIMTLKAQIGKYLEEKKVSLSGDDKQ